MVHVNMPFTPEIAQFQVGDTDFSRVVAKAIALYGWYTLVSGLNAAQENQK